jgi:hypothetical protein
LPVIVKIRLFYGTFLVVRHIFLADGLIMSPSLYIL